ncbi:MAG: STAS domain-containing protein, partial [Marinilabiliaceae bacterium]
MMDSPQLKVTSRDNALVGILEGTDRLNAAVAPEIKEQLNQNLQEQKIRFILDMNNIKFVDSTGIGVLISALKTARQNEGIFLLTHVNKEVMDLLSLMKLDQVFDFQ